MSTNFSANFDDFVVRLPIKLGQFLKLADLAENGAEARILIQHGDVDINGKVETRRGATLAPGDVVSVHFPDETISLRVSEAPEASY